MYVSVGVAETSPPLTSVLTEPGYLALRSRVEISDSNATLAMQLAAGDASALDLLYQRHYEPALAVALMLLRDRRGAEDLVHEAFLRVWRGACSFQPHRGTFRSWLLTIVRNAAVDQLRQQATQRKPTIIAAQESLHASAELDIPVQVIRMLEADRLHQALTQLPPEQRSVIEQAFFAELSHREIADREGLPLGTVKGRVRLGLTRLRTLLEPPEEAV